MPHTLTTAHEIRRTISLTPEELINSSEATITAYTPAAIKLTGKPIQLEYLEVNTWLQSNKPVPHPAISDAVTDT